MSDEPIIKDPEATRTYSINWSSFLTALGGVTIDDSEWDVPSGLTVITEDKTDTITQIKISGGIDGFDYTLYNTISTSGEDIDRRALVVHVRDAAKFSGPWQYKDARDAIRATLAGTASKEVQRYMIGDREVWRYSRSELLEVEARFTQLHNAELRRALSKMGRPFMRNIKVRFTEPR